MFQLIVAVISIALVAILAIASIYYGGSAFLQSSTKAAVTSLVNGGQQIAGAQALYKTDHAAPATEIVDVDTVAGNELAPDYLTQAPAAPSAANGSWTLVSSSLAAIEISSSADVVTICNYAETQALGSAATTFADATAIMALDAPTGQFGCYGDAGTPEKVMFGFKL